MSDGYVVCILKPNGEFFAWENRTEISVVLSTEDPYKTYEEAFYKSVRYGGNKLRNAEIFKVEEALEIEQMGLL